MRLWLKDMHFERFLATPKLLGNLLLGHYATDHHRVFQLRVQLVRESLTSCL